MSHEIINFRDWSGVGLGHDDTPQLREAINQVKGNTNSLGRALGKLRIPAGVYKITNLVLDRSVIIEGDGKRATTLQSGSSTAGSVIEVAVAHDGYNYYAAGGTPPDVVLRDLCIRGAGKSDPSNAHGLLIKNAPTNPITTSIILDNVGVTNSTQNGIASEGGFLGYLRANGGFVYGNWNDGISLNSVSDWQFNGVEIGVNQKNGIITSGCAMLQFDKCYTYSNAEKGWYNFNSSVNFMNSMLDHNGTGGYFHDIRDPRYFSRLFQVWLGLNSRSAENTYSDVTIGYSSKVDLQINSCSFGKPNVGGSKNNIAFENYASITKVKSQFNNFEAGVISSPDVVSHINRVIDI